MMKHLLYYIKTLKAFRTGFLLLYNHLRRLRARKSQSCRRRGSRRRAQKSPTVW
ncbi:unnamed protein product [Brassica oleracea var. botrytis]